MLQAAVFKSRHAFLTTRIRRFFLEHRTSYTALCYSSSSLSENCRKTRCWQPVWRQHGVSETGRYFSQHNPHNRQFMQVRKIRSDHSSKSFVNPLLELQKYVSVPLFSEEQAVFHPSKAEMDKAMLIFQGPKGRNMKNPAKFVGSFVNGSEVPDLNLPEVCFLGRSNVGKSSLISILLSAHPQVNVRVSKKPGHTKTVNLFRLGRSFTLVDMPGYGHNMPHNFQHSAETYLNSGRRLCRTFLLVDAGVGLTSTDVIALDMLQEFRIPFVVVLTKIDKAGRHKLLQNLLSVMGTCQEKGGHTCFSQPFLVSSKTGDGIIYLQTFIAYITGCIAVEGL